MPVDVRTNEASCCNYAASQRQAHTTILHEYLLFQSVQTRAKMLAWKIHVEVPPLDGARNIFSFSSITI